MNRKYIMILSLSCLLSLGIGVFIGYGMNVQNLAGTAVAPNDIKIADGSYYMNGQQYDSETLMMTLQMERADAMESQLVDQANKIKERNTLLAEAQKILTEARSVRPAKEDGTAKMTEKISEFYKQQGIKIVGAAGTDLNQSQWDQNIGLIKGFIDQLNSAAQQDMIKLQELTGKRDQASEMMTEMMDKHAKTRDSIIGNPR